MRIEVNCSTPENSIRIRKILENTNLISEEINILLPSKQGHQSPTEFIELFIELVNLGPIDVVVDTIVAYFTERVLNAIFSDDKTENIKIKKDDMEIEINADMSEKEIKAVMKSIFGEKNE